MARQCFLVYLIFCFSLLWLDGILVGAMRMRLLPDSTPELGPPDTGDDMVVMGDMAMTEELYRYLISPPTTRKVIQASEYKWPTEKGFPTVPYVLNVDRFANEIRTGMEHWQNHTCIKFRPATANDKSYLEFINANGCWSFVGRIFADKKQQVSIGDGCSQLGTVVHEIGHAIGFIHEQMRPDRDNHLHVNLNNVDEANVHNFNKFSANSYVSYGVAYDYTSVMQYGGMDFTKNGKITMATTNVWYQGLLGRGQELSHRDKQVANIHYQCIENWVRQCGFSVDPCQNQGYLGKNCVCVCPPGTSGNYCASKTIDYYQRNLPDCSQLITNEIVFSSPNYPLNIKRDTWCVYKIQAPVDNVVEVKFLDFSLDKYAESRRQRCATAFLEIRDEKLHEGTVVCGKDIATNRTFVSKTRDMALYLDIPYGRTSKGFRAEVKFFPKDSAPDPDPGLAQDLKSNTCLLLGVLLIVQLFAKFNN